MNPVFTSKQLDNNIPTKNIGTWSRNVTFLTNYSNIMSQCSEQYLLNCISFQNMFLLIYTSKD